MGVEKVAPGLKEAPLKLVYVQPSSWTGSVPNPNPAMGPYVRWICLHTARFGDPDNDREPLQLYVREDQARVQKKFRGDDLTTSFRRGFRKWFEDVSPLDGGLFVPGSVLGGLRSVPGYSHRGGHPVEVEGLLARYLCSFGSPLARYERPEAEEPKGMVYFMQAAHGARRFRRHLEQNPDRGDWMKFHQREKSWIMARNPAVYRELGPLVAEESLETLPVEYGRRFQQILDETPSPGRDRNVLQHLQGYLEDGQADCRQRLERLIDEIVRRRENRSSLMVRFRDRLLEWTDEPWLEEQTYLTVDPELGNLVGDLLNLGGKSRGG